MSDNTNTPGDTYGDNFVPSGIPFPVADMPDKIDGRFDTGTAEVATGGIRVDADGNVTTRYKEVNTDTTISFGGEDGGGD